MVGSSPVIAFLTESERIVLIMSRRRETPPGRWRPPSRCPVTKPKLLALDEDAAFRAEVLAKRKSPFDLLSEYPPANGPSPPIWNHCPRWRRTITRSLLKLGHIRLLL